MSDLDEQIKSVRKAFQPKPENEYNYFNRFRLPGKIDPMISNVGYIFFTRPALNIAGNVNKSSFFNSLNANGDFGKYILASLGYSGGNKENSSLISGPFIKILSNSVQNFETKDVALDTETQYQDYYGHKINLPTNIVNSITSDTITINFLEYDDMRVTYLIKAWIDYIYNIKKGVFSPTDTSRKNKILDYSSSIFYFLCGPDGHSIKYYSKLTGCFPINIPYSSFSWDAGSSGTGAKNLSVSFQYQIKEDLEPAVLNDFITIANKGSTSKADNPSKNWSKHVGISTNGGLYYY